MHQHPVGLADAVGAVGGLVLHGRVPPAVDVEHVAGAGEVEAHAAGLEREQEQLGAAGVVLEAIHHRLALGLAGVAVEEGHLLAPAVLQVGLEQVAPLGELGEQQGPVARLDHLLEDLLQPLHLGAAGGKASRCPIADCRLRVLAKGQGGVVAHLLELGEQGQHLAVLLAERGTGDGIEALFHGAVVERLLLGAEPHPLVQLHLLGQVGDDRAVGLEAPQDERPHAGLEVAHRGHVAIALDRQPVALAKEGLIAQHLRIEEVHQRPQLADPVLHWGAGEGDAEAAAAAAPARPGQVAGGHRLLGAGVLDRLGLIDHHPLPVDGLQQFAVALQQAVAGEHQIDALEGLLQGRIGAGPARAVVLLHLELRREGRRLPLPVGEHGGGGHQQHGPPQLLLGLEVLQEGQQLDRLAQTHVVGQAGALVEAVQEGQPAQAPLLVRPQLAGEARGSRQRIGGLLLVVLLQHRLQPHAGHKAVHRQAVEGVALAGGEPQGIVEAEVGVGDAEFLGVAQIGGTQLDPGPLVLHQGAALGLQALQVAQGERHPADHELPAHHQRFAEGEAARLVGQFGLDRQPQAAGQATRQAGRQDHAHAHVAQLGGGGAHQHEGLGRGELHRLRGGGIQAPLDRLEHGEGPPQALQQQLAGLGHGHLAQLQGAVAGAPGHRGRHPQAGIGLGLQAEFQFPQLLPLGGGEQLQAGPGRRHPSGHGLAPVVGGDDQPFEVFLLEVQLAAALAQGFLPGQQQRIKTLTLRSEARPQLAVEQGLQQAGHPQPAAARATAGQGGIALRPGSQGAGGHLGDADRQFLQAVAVALAVEQGQPAGDAVLDLGQPAPPGDQAQGPALQMGPPAQVVGHVQVAGGEGQAAQPRGGAARIEGPALHLPGPPFQLPGDRFAGLQGQAAPALGAGAAAAAAGLGAAGQGEGGAGGPQGLAPVAVVIQPVGHLVGGEGEGMVGGPVARLHRTGHLPGVRPEEQATARSFRGKQPGGVQQAHPRVIRAGGPTGRRGRPGGICAEAAAVTGAAAGRRRPAATRHE